MPRSRSRSRSPKRERRRSKSRERDRSRDRDRHRRHRRSRSRDKGRRRSRSRERRHDRDDRRRDHGDRDRDRGRGRRHEEEEEEELIFQTIDKPPVSEEEIQNMPEDEQELMRVMGFSGFDTTKDKQVVGNDFYSANICKKRRYRQYMNRKGGFNRPLDFIA
ncbi:U4/U6.U5 small nuclear ribonucleoprotein 27 kDa protein-like [Mercenaria mercenaria]|uniref:U4/U6.U5 small nuclear ribonucleoprotein 27 kDa protein-like n=1 Tax=Mercenaria mercenaria TaxID=6596 RepID=UPI001E1DAB80|nr:U4/U6.U5 small nuclear ribonucleoprotein 27 kDa protein-like [Mercenaria mercenaria]